MKILPLLLALGLGVGGIVMPSVTNGLQEGDVRIVAAPASFGVLRPGQSLFVTGTVTNDTPQTVDVGTATVHVSASELVNRAAVDHWLTDDSAMKELRAGASLGEAKIGVLAAGQSRSFSITVPRATLAFSPSESGVFPLEVRLTDSQGVVATQRSAVSQLAEGQTQRLKLSLVTPLNAPASSTGLLDSQDLELLTLPGGLLDEQLNTAMEYSMAIGVDPMIVASIRLLGESAPQSARDWLQRLDAAPNDLFALSYADSDQLLLHRSGTSAPLGPLSFPHQDGAVPEPQVTDSSNGPTPTPAAESDLVPESPVAMRTTIDSLAWPARALTSVDDLDFFAAGGMTRTLLSSSEVAGSTLSTPNVTMGKHQTTVSDDQISALLTTAGDAGTDGEWANAVASLTATLMATATQSPDANVVATFDRLTAPNSTRVADTLKAIESLTWVASTPLSSALTIAPVNGSIVALPADSTSATDSNVDRTSLTKELLTSEASLMQFSSVADDPSLITGPQRLDLLALTSATWERNSAEWTKAVTTHLSNNDRTRSSVHVPESSSITFLQEKGNLPIAVRNELDVPVMVYVTVRPERAILTVKDYQVKLNIDANSQAKASIPVESIANGEVRTTVSLSSATGVAISTPTTVVLNVQAGWETTATVVLAVIVIALFGAGVWRTVLRRRTSRAGLATDAKDLA